MPLHEDSQWLTNDDATRIGSILWGRLHEVEDRAAQAQKIGALDLLDMFAKQGHELRGIAERYGRAMNAMPHLAPGTQVAFRPRQPLKS